MSAFSQFLLVQLGAGPFKTGGSQAASGETWSRLHSVLRSSGTSPNFRISLASPKSPVAGSPLRLKATAPTWLGLRDRASALLDGCVGAQAFRRLAGENVVVLAFTKETPRSNLQTLVSQGF
ncbi:hypothetical protein IVA83_20305 [Bradyrhizobium sp. 143]|nr:hypothetical protein [Bradyrhizobium sp. 143]MCK1723921.1 hypothetical protein [Bradyrhizobium sp. 142]